MTEDGRKKPQRLMVISSFFHFAQLNPEIIDLKNPDGIHKARTDFEPSTVPLYCHLHTVPMLWVLGVDGCASHTSRASGPGTRDLCSRVETYIMFRMLLLWAAII